MQYLAPPHKELQPDKEQAYYFAFNPSSSSLTLLSHQHNSLIGASVERIPSKTRARCLAPVSFVGPTSRYITRKSQYAHVILWLQGDGYQCYP